MGTSWVAGNFYGVQNRPTRSRGATGGSVADRPDAFASALATLYPPDPSETARWATPGELALALDSTTIQTPALDLIDAALIEVEAGRCARLIISMPPQEGKALALDTPIATPTGWTTMGALSVGDLVFGRDGRPCAVTWTSPTWADRPCHRVTTGDGEEIIADIAHEWYARFDRRRSERIVTTAELGRSRQKNASITGIHDLVLPDADLPLSPYVLGAWLGDGTCRAAEITSADAHIVERIRAEGIPCRKRPGDAYSYSLTPANGGTACSPIRRVLVDLDVWGNKHIPDMYQRGSRSQRLALLQGLVDTDGHVIAKGQVEFTNTNRRLAEGVRELVFSLGAKATLTTGRATINGRDCGPKYRVRFYLAGAASLPRKAERCKDSSVALRRYTKAVPCSPTPTRCIEVDSPDHSYLAGRSLLPTHNSQRISRRFPTWMLTRNPSLRVAIASYEHRTARRWGRAIRDDLITHDLAAIDSGSGAADEWSLAGHIGGVYSVGIGGALTGRPVDILIIDDPIKDREQADSPTYRQRVWDWWTDVALTRLAPGAPVVVVLTRWHEDDLAGRLLAAEDAALWTVLNIPAQADHDPSKGQIDPLGREPGEWMQSARRRTPADWVAKRIGVGVRTFTALYQGRPSPESGDVLQRQWWRRYETPIWTQQPDGSYRILECDEVLQSWDMAFKDRKSSDFVVGQVFARRGAAVYLVDQVHARLSFTNTVTAVERMCTRWPQSTAKLVEDKANGTAVIDSLRKKIAGLVPINPTESKYARASAVAPFIEAGNVLLPDASIALFDVEELIEEAAAFPNGAHDDQVDAMSQALARFYLRIGQGQAFTEAWDKMTAGRTDRSGCDHRYRAGVCMNGCGIPEEP